MGLLGWIIGGGLAVGAVARKIRSKEQERQRRRSCQCRFTDGVTEPGFHDIVMKYAKPIKRLWITSINGPFVHGKVRSSSGISEWTFELDFNDYGHLTGEYWIDSENKDSSIPESLAEHIADEIRRRQ